MDGLLEKFKEYARIDVGESDELLNTLLQAAENLALNSGVEAQTDDPLYEVLILMIAAHWYDNRGVASAANGSMSEIPMSATWIIQQLR